MKGRRAAVSMNPHLTRRCFLATSTLLLPASGVQGFHASPGVQVSDSDLDRTARWWKREPLRILDELRKAEKDGGISKDDIKRYEDDLQKLTDGHIATIDAEAKKKEADLLEV